MSQVPSNIKRGRLAADELEQVAALAERRFSAGRIAQKLNRHPGTITYAMHRLGVRKLASKTFAYMRKGVLVKSFSADEDAFLTSLRLQGFSTPKIAARITERFGHRRSAHTINVRLIMLANSEAA